mgnify:CR=1 FL=1
MQTKIHVSNQIAPLLIKGNQKDTYNVMYLSYTTTKSKPSSETKGLYYFLIMIFNL